MFIENVLQKASWKEIYLGVAGLLVFLYVLQRVRESRRIAALGGRAPQIPTYLPLGIDFIIRGFKYAGADENLALWHRFFTKYGREENPYTVETKVVGKRIIFTADHENVKAVLATDFQSFGKGPDFNRDWYPFLGDSIFSTDGHKWHDSRALIRPQFVKDRVSDLQIFEDHVQPLLSLMAGSTDGQIVDVKDLFFRFTLDAATDFLLGNSVESLVNGDGGFAHAFAEIQRLQNNIARAGALNILLNKSDYRRHIATLNAFIEPFINEALAISPAELEAKSNSDGKYTFLHAVAAYTRDRAVLRDQLVAVLLAGRDTTACTLSWLFLEVSQRPDLYAKLRQEVEETVGFSRPPTYADLKAMKFMQQTIDETLRLYSIVPFNVRQSLKDTTLPHGGGKDGLSPIGVPEGTPIAFSSQYMSLIERNYPPVSEKFPDPALFEPRRYQNWQPFPWQGIAFSGGPRLCAGMNFAKTEMGYTIVRILQTFSRLESRLDPLPTTGLPNGFRGVNGSQDQSLVARFVRSRAVMKSEIVLSPAGPVNVAFYK